DPSLLLSPPALSIPPLFPYTTLFRSKSAQALPRPDYRWASLLYPSWQRTVRLLANSIQHALPAGFHLSVDLYILQDLFGYAAARSEERRVGKECRSGCSAAD